MLMLRRAITLPLLTLAAAGAARPAAAQFRECVGATIDECSDAMNGSNWFERWALGVFCSALLTGCAVSQT